MFPSSRLLAMFLFRALTIRSESLSIMSGLSGNSLTHSRASRTPTVSASCTDIVPSNLMVLPLKKDPIWSLNTIPIEKELSLLKTDAWTLSFRFQELPTSCKLSEFPLLSQCRSWTLFSTHLASDGIFVDDKRQVVQQSMEEDDEDEDEGMVPAQQSMEEDDEDEGVVPEDDEDEGMVPAALPVIRSLGASRIKVEEGKKAHQCMVCQEEYCNGEIVTCMPCLHMFHRDCITKWLVKSHLCPVCRFEMPKYS